MVVHSSPGCSRSSLWSTPFQSSQRWTIQNRTQTIVHSSSLRADIRVKLNLAEGTGRLDLSECDLESVPMEVFDLTGLTELSLAGNNLASIPPEIGKLKHLTKLQLSGNRLRQVPDELCLLDALEGLWLHGNLLEHLPMDIGSLMHLKQLAIAGNKLSKLPDSLGLMNALVELVAAGNQLKELPTSLGALSALKNLDLHGNHLRSICHTIGMLESLEELWLQGNDSLESLPPGEALASLHTLKKLSAADCALTSIPPEIGKMQELQDLSLYGNKIKSVPVEIISDAPRLRKLWLEGNPLDPTNIQNLIAAGERKPCFALGLDSTQIERANLPTNATKSHVLQSNIIEHWKGYFKLERHVGSHSSEEEPSSVLVVAFGSAPGVPNWAGALRRVREDFDNDSHADINFDILFVVDPHRSWYGGGDDRYYAYQQAIAKAASNYPHVLFIGDSMGATASLMYAEYATTVHAFCPQIDLGKSSIRPGEEETWETQLRERVMDGVHACRGDIYIHVGNWHHDVQQSNIIPPTIEHARVKIYSVDSHRLALALDKSNKLVPIIRSSILHFHGISSMDTIRISNLL
jgi:Leucine-rich repeat (LRR) protein